MTDILSDKERDALMQTVSQGNDDSDDDTFAEYERYDLTSGVHRIRQLDEAISQIDERLQNTIANALLGILQKNVIVARKPARVEKFAMYRSGLSVPTSMTGFSLGGLTGLMGITLEAGLVYESVNLFFGGASRSEPTQKKEFTVIDERIITMLLGSIVDSMRTVWRAFGEYDVDQQDSEINPLSSKMFRDVEVVLIRPFVVELNGTSAEFHILMPRTMIESILAGKREEVPADTINRIKIKRALNFELEIAALIEGKKLALDEVFKLAVGDVITINSPDNLKICLNGHHALCGKLGELNGRYAVLIK
jgi:flagellar motor switch protein FliM